MLDKIKRQNQNKIFMFETKNRYKEAQFSRN